MEHQSEIQLTLIGKGPEKERLQQLAKELEISHVVKFIDWMSRAELDEYFAMSSVFLFPSCLLYTSPSPRDATLSRMPSSA